MGLEILGHFLYRFQDLGLSIEQLGLQVDWSRNSEWWVDLISKNSLKNSKNKKLKITHRSSESVAHFAEQTLRRLKLNS